VLGGVGPVESARKVRRYRTSTSDRAIVKKRSVFACALRFSPERAAGQTARPEEALARARKGCGRAEVGDWRLEIGDLRSEI
jgi:hypothetical protein